MLPPPGAKITEGELATFWFDEDRILHAVAKDARRTLQKQKDNYALIRELSRNNKTCLLSDATLAAPMDKETRDYSAFELPKIFNAVAVISHSTAGRLISNLFISLKRQPVPIKMFNDEAEAKQWLSQYLEK